MVSINAFQTIFPDLTQYYGKSEAFAGNNLAQAAWLEALKQLTDQEFAIAAKKCIQKHRFLPTPEEFVELITGSDELLAIQEWQKILAWVGSYGGLRSVTKRLPPLLLSGHGEHALKKVGGIHLLSNLQAQPTFSLEDKLRLIEKEFVSYWRKYQEAIKIGQIEPLPAMLDQSYQEEVKITSTSEPIDFDAFKKMREQLKQAVPAFGERIEKAASPEEERSPLPPMELQKQRKEKAELFAESTKTFLEITRNNPSSEALEYAELEYRRSYKQQLPT